jgi:hypothetical protein
MSAGGTRAGRPPSGAGDQIRVPPQPSSGLSDLKSGKYPQVQVDRPRRARQGPLARIVGTMGLVTVTTEDGCLPAALDVPQ